MATLTASNGNSVLTTAEWTGIDISGLIVDAGPVNSPVLVQIGSKNGNNGVPHNQASDPTALQDVFFRVGGPHVGRATVALEVNRDNTILDDLWIWRADHGVAGSVGWTVNTADTGLVVNGDHVTATGLFVEHFQKYNVIWNGTAAKSSSSRTNCPMTRRPRPTTSTTACSATRPSRWPTTCNRSRVTAWAVTSSPT